jgi:hypothetical protein
MVAELVRSAVLLKSDFWLAALIALLSVLYMTIPLNFALVFVQQPDNVVVKATLFALDNVVNPSFHFTTALKNESFCLGFKQIEQRGMYRSEAQRELFLIKLHANLVTTARYLSGGEHANGRSKKMPLLAAFLLACETLIFAII